MIEFDIYEVQNALQNGKWLLRRGSEEFTHAELHKVVAKLEVRLATLISEKNAQAYRDLLSGEVDTLHLAS